MQVWERCVSIVLPTNAPTCARCKRFLLLLPQAYTILGTARIEAETHWKPRVESLISQESHLGPPPRPVGRVLLVCGACMVDCPVFLSRQGHLCLYAAPRVKPARVCTRLSRRARCPIVCTSWFV
jgi:hypothetical protein